MFSIQVKNNSLVYRPAVAPYIPGCEEKYDFETLPYTICYCRGSLCNGAVIKSYQQFSMTIVFNLFLLVCYFYY